ncbi:MAG: glycosyltransferase [Rhodanobacter sp.]|jgi:hypothetical protein|nr:glycosyltransferase [Rhodanobacter sp.]
MSRIHIVARNNGAGLSHDLRILAGALGDAGLDVTVSAVGQGGLRRHLRYLQLRGKLALARWRGGPAQGRFDVNITLERIWRKYPSLAWRNVLIPNPEWFKPEYVRHIGAIDRVFVKTHHAVPIFAALGCRTDYVGFTSDDRLLLWEPREATFFHLAGRSGNKGTQPLVDLWLRHPEWPLLTLVQRDKLPVPLPAAPNLCYITRYLPDEELRVLQNRHLFHLCPSETEGFGHHLVEATSVGAIVLTTAAPPMNELVQPEYGLLVPYARTATQHLARTYFVDAQALEATIERARALDANERKLLSERARAWYESNDADFRRRIVAAVDALACSA